MTRYRLFCKSLQATRWVMACAWVQAALAANSSNFLTIGVPSGLPGYALRDETHLIITDLVKKKMTECIGKKLNAKFTWVSYPNKRIMQMLQVQEVDMIFPMGFTAEREATMLQSHPTWQNPDVFVSLHPVEMQDKTVRIAARFGSPQHADYLAEGYTNLVGVYAYEDLAKLLAHDKVDAVVVPHSIYIEQKNLWPQGAMVSDGRARGSGFYLNKDDPKNLLIPLNQAIERCKGIVGIP